jgi:IS4 transposase
LLSNKFLIPPLVVDELYRYRWHVELFSKWIKQNLRIRAFYGTSENALKTQIWIAVCVYMLVAIVKRQLRLDDVSIYTISQILSVTLFEKDSLLQMLIDSGYKTIPKSYSN